MVKKVGAGELKNQRVPLNKKKNHIVCIIMF